jgi:hypothetical protein
MMAERSDEPPLTEPVIVPCLYVTGFAVEASEAGAVRLVGTVALPRIGGEMDERRIVVRCAMTTAVGCPRDPAHPACRHRARRQLRTRDVARRRSDWDPWATLAKDL